MQEHLVKLETLGKVRRINKGRATRYALSTDQYTDDGTMIPPARDHDGTMIATTRDYDRDHDQTAALQSVFPSNNLADKNPCPNCDINAT